MTDHAKTIVNLPDQIRGGRAPWRGTIADLLALMGDDDHAMEKARHDAQELGLIDAEKINAEDAEVAEAELARFEALLPELLATNLEVLRHFTDDPNAEVVA